mmetsp:Transcript_35686/g.36164  ORF Transcript_35686/g.36164 Transcript_35686/m.36164 type:complete len:102 (+) Transcript_35686:67-372(+)
MARTNGYKISQSSFQRVRVGRSFNSRKDWIKQGLRWRTREEVFNGGGDRTCGNKRCRNNSHDNNSSLVTLEVPFSYYERGVKKDRTRKTETMLKLQKGQFR